MYQLKCTYSGSDFIFNKYVTLLQITYIFSQTFGSVVFYYDIHLLGVADTSKEFLFLSIRSFLSTELVK